MSYVAQSTSSSVSSGRASRDVLWERALSALPPVLLSALRAAELDDPRVLSEYLVESLHDLEEYMGGKVEIGGAPSGAASTSHSPLSSCHSSSLPTGPSGSGSSWTADVAETGKGGYLRSMPCGTAMRYHCSLMDIPVSQQRHVPWCFSPFSSSSEYWTFLFYNRDRYPWFSYREHGRCLRFHRSTFWATGWQARCCATTGPHGPDSAGSCPHGRRCGLAACLFGFIWFHLLTRSWERATMRACAC